MKRVLLYSDELPSAGPDGELGRALHELLSERADVTSTSGDGLADVAGQTFDLLVGIGPRFEEVATSVSSARTVLVTTEAHPVEQAELLRGLGASASELPAAPGVSADIVLCVGNGLTLGSHLEHGYTPERVKLLSHLCGASPTSPPSASASRRFLYLEPGKLAADLVPDLFRVPALAGLDNVRLDVLRAPGAGERQDIADLERTLGERVTVHDDPGVWHELLASADFLICPAIDARHAVLIAEATAHGVIPLVSPLAGIDHSPLGLLELKPGSAHNEAILLTAALLDDAEVDRLKRHTVDYYRQFHADARAVLAETVAALLEGRLHPRVSLVLPIFNKESTIEELLEALDRAVERYPDVELHIFFDGCIDRTEEVVRAFFERTRPSYDVTFETTPDIFEIKTNNLGLRKSTGKYCAILQDDVYVHDPLFLFEAVNFLDRNPRTAILGGLGGVNFFPRGARGLRGPGQVAMIRKEVSWRQNAETDPTLAYRFFEVDACMRGPLFLRKAFLEEYGYLDEIYAPLHQDDMDICFRARHLDQKVYGMLMNVENRSLTVAQYNDIERSKRWQQIVDRNLDVFYERWRPSLEKDHGWVHRFALDASTPERNGLAWRPSAERTRPRLTPLTRLQTLLLTRFQTLLSEARRRLALRTRLRLLLSRG